MYPISLSFLAGFRFLNLSISFCCILAYRISLWMLGFLWSLSFENLSVFIENKEYVKIIGMLSGKKCWKCQWKYLANFLKKMKVLAFKFRFWCWVITNCISRIICFIGNMLMERNCKKWILFCPVQVLKISKIIGYHLWFKLWNVMYFHVQVSLLCINKHSWKQKFLILSMKIWKFCHVKVPVFLVVDHLLKLFLLLFWSIALFISFL